MSNVKSPVLFYGAIAIAVVGLLFCLYYLIPNINHVLIPAYAHPELVHYKYAGPFGGLAILGVILAVIARLKGHEK
jgi:hypothetical protein